MEEWVNSLGLGKHFDLFEQSGFDDYESLVFSMTIPEEAIDERFLWEEIGIEDPNDRITIISRLTEGIIINYSNLFFKKIQLQLIFT